MMSKFTVFAISILVFALSFVTLIHAQFVPIDLDALEVLKTRSFDLFSGPLNTSSYLAPNGEYFAHLDGNQICIYESNGLRMRCISLAEPTSYDQMAPRWSPDSRYLAFIDERPLIKLVDSDLWLLDIDSGTLTNLTDDGADYISFGLRPLGQGEPDGMIDIAPHFSADSQRIYFIRYETRNDQLNISLYRIGVGGDDLTSLYSFTDNTREYGWVSYFDISPDEQTVIYDILNRSSGNSVNVLDLAAGETRLLYTPDPETENAATAFDFSPSGDAVLVQNASLNVVSDTEPTGWHIVTLDGDKRPAVVPPAPGTYALSVGWSPDGSGLVYLVRGIDAPELEGLYVGAPGEAGRLILPGPEEGYLYPPSTFGDRLDWGANGVVLVTVAGGKPTTTVFLGTP